MSLPVSRFLDDLRFRVRRQSNFYVGYIIEVYQLVALLQKGGEKKWTDANSVLPIVLANHIERNRLARDVIGEERFYGTPIESMYYQYAPQSKGWKPERKQLLADKLQRALKLSQSYSHLSGSFPFIQIDRYGDDVTISRITHLSEKEQDKLVETADKVYDEVMS